METPYVFTRATADVWNILSKNWSILIN